MPRIDNPIARRKHAARAVDKENRRRIANGAKYICSECEMTYHDVAGRTSHLLRVHRIDVRVEGATRGKHVSQSRQGFARVQSMAVRGNNVDSEGLWMRLGGAMFGGRKAA